MREEDEKKPAAASLAPDEIVCMYCEANISRKTRHRTCAECAARWAKEFGPKWYEEPWHAELVADHKLTFGDDDSQYAESLELMDDIAQVEGINPPIVWQSDWRPDPKWTEVYLVIKDALLVADLRGSRVGRVRMQKELARRGMKNLPAPKTIESYIYRARNEIKREAADRVSSFSVVAGGEMSDTIVAHTGSCVKDGEVAA